MRESFEIEFEVKRVIYQNTPNKYKVLKVEILRHPTGIEIPTAEHIVAGDFPYNVNIKDTYKASGKWVDKGVHGYQFIVESAILTIPETEKGLVEFLSRNIKGVGPKTAKNIVEKFGIKTLDIIKNKPERLKEVQGITYKKAERIKTEITTIKEFEDIFIALYPLGYGATEIQKIHEIIGSYAVDKIKENPYIVRQVKISNFKTIDRAAEKMGLKPNSPLRIRQGILEYISYNLQNMGNLFVYKKDLYENLAEHLNNYGGFTKKLNLTKEEIDKELEVLKEKEKIVEEETLFGDKCIYFKFYRDIENKTVNILKKDIGIENATLSNGHIEKFIKDKEKEGVEIGEQQKEAIRMALTNKISILTGGPGTGKTFTANLATEAIEKYSPYAKIELAAPTGKAAKRMTELTGKEAKTIHRLIGLNGLEEEEGLSNLKEIDADFLVIDEASMVDAYLFYCLLTCIKINTNVLIIGDHQQLPSVGPGLILRDLIDSNKIPTTILTEIYRQEKDSQIIINANKIINGDKDLSRDNNKGDFYFVNNPEITKIKKLVLKSLERLIETGWDKDDIQVLTVMNKGDLGTKQLNKEIQAKFNPPSKNKEEIRISTERVFRVGDRVMQTENNYDLEVYNGEVGKIVDIKNGDIREITVDFGDKKILYVNEMIPELTLAYAITVHKSQGSEFDAVIMPIHQTQEILLNRNIIYTAVTRAKERVVLIGDKKALNKGIDATDNTIRNSRIKEKLNLEIMEKLPF